MNRSAPLVVAALCIAAACSNAHPHRPAGAVPTFAADVAPLLRDKCGTCHHAGGSAPFALTTYEQIAALGTLAKSKVTLREMPPWGAFNRPDCEMRQPFKDDLSLTEPQIDTFARWVEGGMPRGEAAPVAPPEPAPAPTSASRHGASPTHDFEIAGDFEVSPGAPDELRCFPFDPGLKDADTWVTEAMIVPRDPRVVHHALVYIDDEHESLSKAGADGSYPCFGGPDLEHPALVLAWSPGGAPTVYGEGAALRIPKDAHLVVQVHYHPLGTRAPGGLSLSLAAGSRPPDHVASFVLVGGTRLDDGTVRLLPGPDDPPGGPEFVIPSGAKGHTETLELVLPDGIPETRIAAAGAHMHLAGVGMKIEVEHAASAPSEPMTECLLSQPKYKFQWQRTFAYDAPLSALPSMRGGDKLRMTCTYDNSMDNLDIARLAKENRRTEPVDIHLGADSRDEMCQAMLVLVE